jgi:DNA-binding NtrC family response regulator
MSEPRMAWIAEDPASKAVVELARKVAETSTTLLITGESGTGKDHLARLIHELGPRRDAPFLKIDCASLPQELVESELFGHERGAFTGAVEQKFGRLEMAGAGTIVLDEVAALSPPTQSKLLRVLEERQFERLGGTETITIAARLVGLTNADLARLVSDGQFREDLFFRLSVLTIAVPPLRARPADILPLADALLERAARIHGRPGVVFSEPVRRLLGDYRWPGNVRELKNSIERALVFSDGSTLLPEDFPEAVRMAGSDFGVALRSLEDIERDAIRATLEATRYKIGKSAEILGISRKTLLDKRKKYGLN